MNLCEKHFKETKKLLDKISTDKISNWLLDEGYYPEQYVLPPSFNVKSFSFNKTPYFKVINPNRIKFKIESSEHISLSFPKSKLTDRIYGIIEPKIYHDIVWHIIKDWKLVYEHLFNKDIKIYPNSFPIPVTKKSLTNSNLSGLF